MVGISVSLPEAFDDYTRGPMFGNKEEVVIYTVFLFMNVLPVNKHTKSYCINFL